MQREIGAVTADRRAKRSGTGVPPVRFRSPPSVLFHPPSSLVAASATLRPLRLCVCRGFLPNEPISHFLKTAPPQHLAQFSSATAAPNEPTSRARTCRAVVQAAHASRIRRFHFFDLASPLSTSRRCRHCVRLNPTKSDHWKISRRPNPRLTANLNPAILRI